jgi:hypothetical protein
MAAGGPVNIIATLDGKSDTSVFNVQARLSFIKRVNFQVSSTPWSYGWLADNGQTFSAAQGYGWNASLTSTARDDRNGSNFLLKSFVSASTNTWRVVAPNGTYIVKIGMGDNIYGTASTASTLFGTETVCSKAAGQGNTVTVDTITVTGGQGAIFVVNGPINYIVMISNEGIDINSVAWDDGTSIPLPPSKTEFISLAAEKAFALRAYPNPFHSSITLELENAGGLAQVAVYNLQGRKVADLTRSLANGRAVWRPSVCPGLYVAKACVQGKTLTRKLALIK